MFTFSEQWGEFMTRTFSDILICDDHSVCRMGVAATLRECFSHAFQIREVASGEAAVRAATDRAPDLAILDLGLPDISGLEVVRRLRALSKDLKILILTSCDHPVQLKQVLRAPIDGVLQKTYSMEQLGNVMSRLTQDTGGGFVDPSIEKIFADEPVSSLTKREYEVLELIAKGLTSKETAALLHCSMETVKTHRAHIMEKIKVRNTAEMMAWYLQGDGKVNGRSVV